MNHAWGAESRLSHDHVLQLDRLLQDFFGDLDLAVGRDHYLALLTADHGFMPFPEHSLALGRDAGRVDTTRMIARLNAGLAKRFGEGTWALGMSAQAVVINRLLISQRKVSIADFSEESRRLLLAEPGVAAVYTRAERKRSRAGAPLFDGAQVMEFTARATCRWTQALLDVWSHRTTHGSPIRTTPTYRLIYGPSGEGRRIDEQFEMADVADARAPAGVPDRHRARAEPLPLEAPRSETRRLSLPLRRAGKVTPPEAWFADSGWRASSSSARCGTRTSRAIGAGHSATGSGKTLPPGSARSPSGWGRRRAAPALRVLWITPMRALAGDTVGSWKRR